MNHAFRVACLTLLVFAVSCQSSKSSASEGTRPQAGAVTHVVLVWLRTPGDEAARRKIIETGRTFEAIPGVVSVTSGTALPSTRPIVDSSYDVGVVMTFTDEAALRAYDQHPTHKRAVEEVLRPLSGKLLIYDIKGQ